MKSRQLIWLLLIYCIFNLQTFASTTSNPTSVSKKVYILLRTEQNSENLKKFKSLVESDLLYNNVSAQISTYRVSEPLPQMKIFKAAYQENFDYILLIDQVANYNVGIANKRVNVGGKFKLQSYNLKSSNPSWTNHGDANCNITVIKSVQEFSKQIMKTISPNESIKLIAYSDNNSNYTASNSNIEVINIPENKLKEVKLLNTQIKLEKAKTKRILSEIELATLKTEKELELEIQKNKKLALEIAKYR